MSSLVHSISCTCTFCGGTAALGCYSTAATLKLKVDNTASNLLRESFGNRAERRAAQRARRRNGRGR